VTATPLWWLTYRQGKVTCVLIVEADSLVEARLKADVGLVGGHAGIDAHFLGGHELASERIPEAAVGRLMTAADAAKLVEALDPIPKKPPAPSIRRKASARTRLSAK
jgi:hypothetical protein